MIINRALLKYGYSEFRLDILEYCSKEDVLTREQYYLDLLKPKYNILKTAGSSLGFKHTKETIEKFQAIAKLRKYTEEEKGRVSKLYINRTLESKIKDRERILEINKTKSHIVEVIDITTNKKVIYCSIRQAAESLDCAHTTIRRALKSKNVFKDIYKVNYANSKDENEDK